MVMHNSALSQFPFYVFKRILAYKAPLAGKRVENGFPYLHKPKGQRSNHPVSSS